MNIARRYTTFTKKWVDESVVYKPSVPPLVGDSRTGWTQSSVRCGALAVKLGMMGVWNEYFEYMPITVLEIPDCRVVQAKHGEATKEGYVALQVGAMPGKSKRVSKPLLGHFLKAGVPPFKRLAEFRVTRDALLAPGAEIRCEHFVPGQLLDVSSVCKGKGFQGVMKRWNYGGGAASHGNSLSHRAAGSTGQNQDPGRVFKGKAMAGQMGNKRVTVKNLPLWGIVPERNYLLVRGHVPGGFGTYVQVRDAKNKRHDIAPPFPTWDPQRLGEAKDMPPLICAESKRPEWFLNMQARHEERRIREEEAAKAGEPLREFAGGDDPAAVQAALRHYDSFPFLFRIMPHFYQPREPKPIVPLDEKEEAGKWDEFLQQVWKNRRMEPTEQQIQKLISNFEEP